MLHPISTHDNTTRRLSGPTGRHSTDARQRTENATYTRIVQAIEAEQKRKDAMRQMTAAFTGVDDGDILFAA
jgi:hypothetical protein